MAGKDKKAKAEAGEGDIEQGVVALAQQIGWFLGKVQKRADGWLENETLQKQVSQMRDGAIELLGHVTRASAGARDAVSKAVDAAKVAAQQADVAAARPAPKARAAKATAAAKKPTTPAVVSKARASRGPVDAPGKKHRKPPPQEKVDRRMGEPAGKKAGQKSFRVGKSRGRG